jgi:hypothetical protein
MSERNTWVPDFLDVDEELLPMWLARRGFTE